MKFARVLAASVVGFASISLLGCGCSAEDMAAETTKLAKTYTEAGTDKTKLCAYYVELQAWNDKFKDCDGYVDSSGSIAAAKTSNGC